MSKPLPRLSACPQCNGAVEIEFEYWQPGYLAHDVTWVCPLCSLTVNLGIPGRLVSVTPRNPSSLWLG